MANLSEIQTSLAALVRHPDGCATFRKQHPTQVDRLFSNISQTENFSSEQRLNVYHEAYFSRLLEVLAGQFPKTRNMLNNHFGSDAFTGIAMQYLEQHHSRSANIVLIGKSFPHFLRNCPLSLELAFLGELASLEWALIEVFHHRLPQSIEGLSSLEPSQWEKLWVKLAPSAQFFKHQWTLSKIWETNETVHVCEKENFVLIYFSPGKSSVLEEIDEKSFNRLKQLPTQLPNLFGATNENAQEVQSWFHEFIRRNVLELSMTECAV